MTLSDTQDRGLAPRSTPSIAGRACRPLTGIEFCAWLAQAAPGDLLVYHRGFLAADIDDAVSELAPKRRRALRDVAAVALRAANQRLVHLVQARLGSHCFAYIAIARSRSKTIEALLPTLLLENTHTHPSRRFRHAPSR